MRGPGRASLRRGPSRAFLAWSLPFLLALPSACKARPELRPDQILKDELGLTDRDEVHRILVTGGDFERIEPPEIVIRPGAYVEFFTTDWRTHEVRFEVESLGAEARRFLESTDQVASPPLLRRESRFVVTFEAAPTGRYPFVVEGNTAPGRGAVVVSDESR